MSISSTTRPDGQYWVRFGVAHDWEVMRWDGSNFWGTAGDGYRAEDFEVGPQVFPPNSLTGQGGEGLQARVAAWMLECFGAEISADKVERADRFVEEVLELAQSIGWTPDRGHALVDYVFARPIGEPGQEVGGVMVTLAALCNVFDLNIDAEATREVNRITQPEMVLKIRAKQAAKPTGSALPVAKP